MQSRRTVLSSQSRTDTYEIKGVDIVLFSRSCVVLVINMIEFQ